MAYRLGINGAIVRPPLTSRRQNIARATASRIIDLTEDSPSMTENSAETNNGSSETSDDERRPPRVGLTRSQLSRAHGLIFHRPVEMRHSAGASILPPDHIYTTSYVVSNHYHQPCISFGQGDDSDFIDLYASLDQAIDAALKHYRRQMNDDGWECEWDQIGGELYGNERLRLQAQRVEGEADTETLTINIKKIRHIVDVRE